MTTDREQEAVSIAMTALRERDEALAREAVLREALEPFSDAAGNMDKYDPLRLPDKGYLAFGMRYGHLRAAQVFVAALGASTAAAAAARDAALRMEATGDEMSVLHMAPHDGEIIRLRAENATLTDCLGHILIAIHDDSDVRRKLGDDEATERAVARWYSLRTENERLTAIVTDDNGPWRLEAAKKRIAELEDRHADLAARAADLTLKAQAVAKADRAALTHRVAEAVREACKQAIIGTYGDTRNHHRMDAIDLAAVLAGVKTGEEG